MNNKLLNITALFILLTVAFYILNIGSSILLPFIVAVVVWYIIIALADTYKKINIKGWQLPPFLALVLAVATTVLVLNFVFVLITRSIYNIVNDAPTYQQKLQALLAFLGERFDVQLHAKQMIAKIDIRTALTNVTLALTTLLQNLVLIIIYVGFLLLEYNTFEAKLAAIFPNAEKLNKAIGIVGHIRRNIDAYIKLKTVVSFFTGLLCYLVLLMFGIQNAIFWAVLIFLLNFIPTIGSIIAVGLVLLVASIQFTSLITFLAMSLLLVVIQFVFGNVVEPRLTGRNLNLSPLVILLSLALWSKIWGILGMFLCVPIMTIVNIILAEFPSTRPIAVFLAADPKLANNREHR